MGRPRILLVDDHVLLLDALTKLLERDCDIVSRFSDGAAVVDAVAQLRPDLVVLDISMRPPNGLQIARRLKATHPSVKLVFLTMNDDTELAAEALKAGGSAYVLKSCAASELLTAIHVALEGGSYMTPRLTQDVIETLTNRSRHATHDLSPRQRDVLELLTQGASMKEAASTLNVSPRTIAFHKYRMMSQLGLTSTAELVRYAIKHNIV